MPDWKNYEQRYRAWYMRHKKQIYVATAISFVLMLIGGIITLGWDFLDLDDSMALVGFVMFLTFLFCTIALFYLIMVGEERYFSRGSTPLPTR